ncbi:cell division ftsk/spoiiie [Bacillus sp. OxB-1]|uniref:DNA translocase FtsK n=1 Tax=Bacillus sp. (strain OxB-1) TaxID=98228 RepID=UPI000581FE6A|nr:DNA translocase FtsK [Bacillus sp. OxB-1]BAQ11789.1 cell division ftsk/spoiiie [Bacillus sp. OxB-1]
MSWFKKVVNRLFGPDEEEKFDEIDSIEQEEVKEIPTETKTPPSFRFPIITDAEIYGWDEEDEERPERKPVEKPIGREEDDYETIPLYKNERWPETPATGTIHRAGSSRLKYGSEPSHERIAPKPVRKEQKPASAKIETKRNGRPFTPTAIPSPVFGFSRPENLVDRSMEEERKSGISKQNVKEWENIPDEQPSTLASLVEKDSIEGAAARGSEVFTGIAEEAIGHTTEKETHIPSASDHAIVEEPAESDLPIEEQSVNEQPMEEWIEPDDEDVLEQQIDEGSEREQSNSDVADQLSNLPEPEPVADESTVIPHEPELEEPIMDEQDEPMSDPPEKMEEPLEESDDSAQSATERIVPFNVLMLKSDKEKLEKIVQAETNSSTPPQPVSGPPETRPEPEPPEVAQNEVASDAVSTMEPEEEVEPPYYAFPSLDYLIPPEDQVEDSEWLESQSEKLEVALSHFSVQATVIEAVQGPSVTRFELTVAQGTKVSKVRNLADDLKLALAAEDIRIQAPIPGRSSIGIEIPNRKTRPVRISEVIGSDVYKNSPSPLEAVLGLGLTGKPVTIDLRKMPHGMIAGATGSGKSVCINSILISLLYKAPPTDLKMMLIDPKMVELAPFNGIPHLISPVITDVKAATAALKWAVAEMERRYELLAHAGVRDIDRYNRQVIESRKFSLKMPYLLIVIDELADLMMMAPADVEVSISRIAQKARACGIHLIIATQRPSVDVITGTIKANVPTRIAFSVSSQIDSRTILDSPGAERLLGKGDMLYIGNGQSSAVRLQGTFVTDDEIERIIEHVQNEAEPDYLFGQEDLLAHAADEEEKDPLYEEACHFILEQGSASTSLLQRHFSIGYNRAAKLIDRMEKQGFISGQRGSKARDVYLTENDLEKIYKE